MPDAVLYMLKNSMNAMKPFTDSYEVTKHPSCRGDQKVQPQCLDALHPMPVLPARQFSKRSRSVKHLRRIDLVQVRKCERPKAKHTFMIDVYFRDADSHIPVHSPKCMGGGHERVMESSVIQRHLNHEPSVQVEHTFADFVAMRKYFNWLARTGHFTTICTFCHSMICSHTNSEAKPRWNTTWFKTDEELCQLLTTYLNELLSIVEKVPMSGPEHCEGQDRIPRVLSRFLKPTFDSRDE